MKILVCSDGHAPAENAIRFATEIAAACKGRIALLGIVEHPDQEHALLGKLHEEARALRARQLEVDLLSKHGHPPDEIKKIADQCACDLVVIGAERKRGGPFSMSAKAYRLVKLLAQPVFVVIGAPAKPRRILLCTGGDTYIQKAVDFTARIASCLGAEVGVLHVMAGPPPVYSTLAAQEENVEELLQSASVLGRNLRGEKEVFDKWNVRVEIRLRHGLVVPEIFKEFHERDYDMIVAGAALKRGPIGQYMLGDVTREIIDRAECPVLVVRGARASRRGFFSLLARIFKKSRS